MPIPDFSAAQIAASVRTNRLRGYGRGDPGCRHSQRQHAAFRHAGVDPAAIHWAPDWGDPEADDASLRGDGFLASLQPGQIVVVWRLDALAQTCRDLYSVVKAIRRAGAHLRVLTVPDLDSTKPGGRDLLRMIGVMASFESDVAGARVRSGQNHAARLGRSPGRPSRFTDAEILAAAGAGTRGGAARLGMSPAGFSRALARAQERTGPAMPRHFVA